MMMVGPLVPESSNEIGPRFCHARTVLYVLLERAMMAVKRHSCIVHRTVAVGCVHIHVPRFGANTIYPRRAVQMQVLGCMYCMYTYTYSAVLM